MRLDASDEQPPTTHCPFLLSAATVRPPLLSTSFTSFLPPPLLLPSPPPDLTQGRLQVIHCGRQIGLSFGSESRSSVEEINRLLKVEKMTTVCTPTPTLTRTVTQTTTSLSTTSTTSLTTLPDSVSVTTIPCPPQPTGSVVSVSVCVPTVSTITIPGNTSVITIPVTVPVDVFVTDTTTLFGTACSTSIPPSVPPTVPPTTAPPPPLTSPPVNNNSSSSSIPPSSTPSLTYSSTPSSSQPPAPTNTLQDPPSTNQKSNSIGPIVGGVVGGLAVLILLGFFTLRFIKKQHRFDSLFNDKDDDKSSTTPFRKNPLESDFNYNPIGQQKPPSGITPPSSPPPSGQGTFNNAAHGRRPSITPLLGGLGGAAGLGVAANGVGSASSSYNNIGGASGPSTVSSQQRLVGQMPMSTGNVQSQGYYPPLPQQGIASSSTAQPMSYPPKPQQPDTWNPSTLYGPSTSNAVGYAGGLSSNPSVGSSLQPSSSSGLGYTTSVGSVATGVSSWGATSVTTSSARRNSTQPGFAALGQQLQQPQPRQSPMLYTQYEDPFARSGSPVSIQEQRILQVVNAEPSSPSASSNAVQAQSSSQAYHVANLSATEQEVVGAGAGAAAQRDGNGGPMRDEKSPAVHLNGALYQEPPAPPAYQL
ncbi:hypothetical protein D9619_005230 [Psilocybe cf. subviscida]|uniref:Uncharacterized protein n=1 Tax=Psilocybe cf. subviscida TaxID=2480587 RepID=A0A8H5BVW5_9AGAR|nr:hypothetical protein D9619_005230 [Psilocybe cf. subviscida]